MSDLEKQIEEILHKHEPVLYHGLIKTEFKALCQAYAAAKVGEAMGLYKRKAELFDQVFQGLELTYSEYGSTDEMRCKKCKTIVNPTTPDIAYGVTKEAPLRSGQFGEIDGGVSIHCGACGERTYDPNHICKEKK